MTRCSKAITFKRCKIEIQGTNNYNVFFLQEIEELKSRLDSGQTDDEVVMELKARHAVQLQTLEQTISAKYQEEYLAQLGEAILEKDAAHQVSCGDVILAYVLSSL